MKKIICLVITLVMTLAIVFTTAEAATYNSYGYFSDVPTTHWAYNYIQYAAQNGLVNGYNNGTFVPNGTLSETECCQIVYNACGNNYQYNQYNQYNNQYSQYWYSEAVNFVERNSTLRVTPNQPATRSFVCMLVYAFSNNAYSNTYTCYSTSNGSYGFYNYNNQYSYPGWRFSDCYNLPSDTQNAINYCQSVGIVNGYQDGTFRPYNSLTRAEGAKIFTICHQQIWQNGYYNYNNNYNYYSTPAEMLAYAENLCLTADLEGNGSQNQYRQTLTVYVQNASRVIFTYANGTWYDKNNQAYSADALKNWLNKTSNQMTQQQKALVACQVTRDYAKSLGYRIIDLGEWPSYDNSRGVYWHRLHIANNRQDFEFLCGGNVRNGEAYWYLIDTNGFKAMSSREEVKDLIARWS